MNDFYKIEDNFEKPRIMLDNYKDVLLKMATGNVCTTLEEYKDAFMGEIKHMSHFSFNRKGLPLLNGYFLNL